MDINRETSIKEPLPITSLEAMDNAIRGAVILHRAF